MIMQPDHITAEMFGEAADEVSRKKPSGRLDEVKLERFREGLCVQIMHIGSYADEPRTVDKMAAFAEERGYRLRGPHHEDDPGNPATAKPENLKTVLRRGVAAAE